LSRQDYPNTKEWSQSAMGWWESLQLQVGGVESRVRAVEQLGASGNLNKLDAVAATALEDKSPQVQKAAADALGKLGDPRAVSALATLLLRGQGEVQKAAALALQKIGGVQAVAPLAAALSLPDLSVSQAALEALIQIGPPSLGPLVGLLKDMNREARRRAGLALAGIGSPAVPPLVVQLKEKDPELRRLVAEILVRIGPPGLEAITSALHDPDPEVRRMVAEVLGKIGDAKATTHLLPLLQDAFGGVRDAAARALETLGWRPDDESQTALRAVALRDWKQAIALGSQAMEPLMAAVKDADSRLAEAAVDALTKIGSAATPHLLAILQDESPIKRSQVVRALGEIGGDGTVSSLVAALKDSDTSVRESAILALWRTGGAVAVDGLLQALLDADPLIRSRAARALGEMGDPRAVEPLCQLSQRDGYVRPIAALAIWKLDPPRAVAPLALWAAFDATADEAITALTQLLERDPTIIGADDLQAVAKLGDIRRMGLVKKGDPATVSNLARNELSRRGIPCKPLTKF
jgi:HEAT repeat protein